MDYNPKNLKSVLLYMRQRFNAELFEEASKMFSIQMDLAPGLKPYGNVLRQVSEEGLTRELREASGAGDEAECSRVVAKVRKWLRDYLMLMDDKADSFMTALQAVYGLEHIKPPEMKRSGERTETTQTDSVKTTQTKSVERTQTESAETTQTESVKRTQAESAETTKVKPTPSREPPPLTDNLIASGFTGECTWTLDDNYLLTISGQGKMGGYLVNDGPGKNRFDAQNRPWRDYGRVLKQVTLERGVTCVGDFAFHGCAGLVSVTIPDSVTSIGFCAFSGCSSLISVKIPKRVLSIGNGAFRGCSALTEATIPDSVASIGSSAFADCQSLKKVSVAKHTKIAPNAFSPQTEVKRR